jgi:formate-dependent nitrite reductase membrane component NrfD
VRAPLFDAGDGITTTLLWALAGATAGLLALLAIELTSRGTAAVELALAAMTRGDHADAFWAVGVGVGMVVPLALAVLGLLGADAPPVTVAAGVAALAGLYSYEDAFVRAGQAVPLS